MPNSRIFPRPLFSLPFAALARVRGSRLLPALALTGLLLCPAGLPCALAQSAEAPQTAEDSAAKAELLDAEMKPAEEKAEPAAAAAAPADAAAGGAAKAGSGPAAAKAASAAAVAADGKIETAAGEAIRTAESADAEKETPAGSGSSGQKKDEAGPKDRGGAAKAPSRGDPADDELYPENVKRLWPRVESLVTSAYGEQRGGMTRYSRARRHMGLDIRAHQGWPIRSLRNGVVTAAGFGGRAGLMVKVRQDNGRTVTYAHMSEILVKKGQKVSRGQYVGRVGCTGVTTGSHLHIGVRDAKGNPVNPRGEFTGLWELFDPPVKDISGPIEAMACSRRDRLKGSPNKRLIGTQHYLRMRRLSEHANFSVPDLP
ncbi:MAG: M23 family metallopeptidase [Desulfovibrionaceae bacterium]|nr:M23 family metallopeptidase [Desulfovibrionaceae bacterium]